MACDAGKILVTGPDLLPPGPSSGGNGPCVSNGGGDGFQSHRECKRWQWVEAMDGALTTVMAMVDESAGAVAVEAVGRTTDE